MEFKGTKGEWYLQEYTDDYTNIIRCNSGEGFENIYIAATCQGSNPEHRRNAQLMASAPRLLQELKDVRAALIMNNNPSDKMLLDSIEATIKTATDEK